MVKKTSQKWRTWGGLWNAQTFHRFINSWEEARGGETNLGLSTGKKKNKKKNGRQTVNAHLIWLMTTLLSLAAIGRLPESRARAAQEEAAAWASERGGRTFSRLHSSLSGEMKRSNMDSNCSRWCIDTYKNKKRCDACLLHRVHHKKWKKKTKTHTPYKALWIALGCGTNPTPTLRYLGYLHSVVQSRMERR